MLDQDIIRSKILDTSAAQGPVLRGQSGGSSAAERTTAASSSASLKASVDRRHSNSNVLSRINSFGEFNASCSSLLQCLMQIQCFSVRNRVEDPPKPKKLQPLRKKFVKESFGNRGAAFLGRRHGWINISKPRKFTTTEKCIPLQPVDTVPGDTRYKDSWSVFSKLGALWLIV